MSLTTLGLTLAKCLSQIVWRGDVTVSAASRCHKPVRIHRRRRHSNR